VFKNKTFVGAFVLGSIMLIGLAFFLLGYGNFGKQQTAFALFFDSSLRGLNIDSPVFFKGVSVGRVRSIYIVPHVEEDTFDTVVIIELDEKLGGVDSFNEDRNFLSFIQDDTYMYGLIDKGLRAKLTTASLITGQLVIELIMVNNPEPLKEIQKLKYENMIQIPTLPNVIESILSNFEGLPFHEISSELLHLLENLNRTLAEINVRELGKNLNAAIVGLRNVENEAQGTIKEYNNFAYILKDKVPSILQNLNNFARNSSKITQDDSALMQELFLTLQALRDAANSISYLAELLENQPDALIFGKAK
jgi:paraquat-inducible protein B